MKNNHYRWNIRRIFFMSFSMILIFLGLLNTHLFAKDSIDSNEHNQNWIKNCEKSDQGKNICSISQNIFVEDSGRLLMSVSLTPSTPNVGYLMNFNLPLGIYLPAGMVFNIDGGEQVPLPIILCLPDGCKSEFKVDNEKLKAMQSGLEIKVAFLNAGTRKQILVKVSLKGLRDAIATL